MSFFIPEVSFTEEEIWKARLQSEIIVKKWIDLGLRPDNYKEAGKSVFDSIIRPTIESKRNDEIAARLAKEDLYTFGVCQTCKGNTDGTRTICNKCAMNE